MAKKKESFALKTRQLTGMSEAEYKTAYTKFAARVRNYNAIAGTKYSAAKEFYYSYRYADNMSPALKAITATPATRARKAEASALQGKSLSRVEKMAYGVFMEKWAGWWAQAEQDMASFGSYYSEALEVRNALMEGRMTFAEADKRMRELAKIRHQHTDRDPSYRY